MAYGDERRSYGRGGYGGSRGGYGGYGGRGGFGEERDLPKPIKPGDELDVEIEEVGTKGDGIARVKNFVVFVAGAKKGEKLRIRIKDVMSRFATAEKVGAGTAAADATEIAPAEEVAPAEAATAEVEIGESNVEEEASESAEAEEAEVEVVEEQVEGEETKSAEGEA
jgi:predicted RNA-binding protein with TRAM domain